MITLFRCFPQEVIGHYKQCSPPLFKPIDFQIDLFFFERGSYMIEMRECSRVFQADSNKTNVDELEQIDDIDYVIILSNGAFRIDSNKLFLKDDIENYTMVFYIENDRLVADKTFGFMKNVSFCYSNSVAESWVTERFKNAASYFTQTECETYNAEQTTQKPLKYGIYGDKYDLMSNSFNYRINQDSTYAITYKRKIISEGMWQRENNVLILTDKDLQFPFYLLIGDGVLIKKQSSRNIKIPFVPEYCN